VEWVETTAKTVDAAKELALDGLGVDEQDAEFEVLEEPRAGLFGRVRGEARVRARVRPVQARPKNERRERRKPRGSSRGASGDGGAPRAATDASTDTTAGDTGSVESAADDTGSDGAGGHEASAPSGRSRAPRSRKPKPETTPRPAAPVATAATDDEESTMSQDVTVEEQGEMVEEFLAGLVAAFGYDATVGSTKVDDDTVEVSADGEDMGLLVGPKGATLQAIHDLSRTVVQRQASGHHEGRVRIDVGGYREKRRAALERFTQKVAEEVVASGSERVLEPMSPADRKVVHDTATSIDGVRTSSEGEEPRRRVVIHPDND
jgi:spoIIIJ-associated protein